MKLLGTTKLTKDRKMTLIRDVSNRLKADSGDLIAFYEKNGEIVIKKG